MINLSAWLPNGTTAWGVFSEDSIKGQYKGGIVVIPTQNSRDKNGGCCAQIKAFPAQTPASLDPNSRLLGQILMRDSHARPLKERIVIHFISSASATGIPSTQVLKGFNRHPRLGTPDDRDRGSQPLGSPDRVTIEPTGLHLRRGEPADGDIWLASVAADGRLPRCKSEFAQSESGLMRRFTLAMTTMIGRLQVKVVRRVT
jgi:hypothetical protein